MTFGSLFTGIGGFDLGLERAGMRCLWQVENNAYCTRVLEKHWPRVRRYGDIREIDPSGIAAVDLVCGGFPCQPFSNAGERKGEADDRHLWSKMLRIIFGVRPAWVLGENVDGLRTLGLDRVLSDLEGAGYAVRPLVIPACAVDAPHRRDRVWIVAHSQGQPERSGFRPDEPEEQRRARSGDGRDGSLAYTAGGGRGGIEREQGPVAAERGRPPAHGGEHGFLADASFLGRGEGRTEPEFQERRPDAAEPCSPWEDAVPVQCRDGRWRRTGPGVRMLAHGIPGRVDQLGALGNAVVPQLVEIIGRTIVAMHFQTNPELGRCRPEPEGRGE